VVQPPPVPTCLEEGEALNVGSGQHLSATNFLFNSVIILIIQYISL